MLTAILLLLLAALIIFLNAFFVLGEFALVKVRRTSLIELASRGGDKEKMMLLAHEHIDDYLSSIQIGVTMTSLALGWVGEPSVGKIIQWLFALLGASLPPAVMRIIAFVCAFMVITSLHVVFGEQAPKLISIRYAEAVLRKVIVPLHYFHSSTKVFRKLLVAAAYKILIAFGINPHKEEAPISQEEIQLMLLDSQERGKFSMRRLMMFENLFDFERVVVKEIMTPREKISAIRKGNSWADNFSIIKARRFSRYPLYEQTIDDSKEYVLIKEMSLDALSEHNALPIEEKYAYPLVILDENTPVETALREFQSNRKHQALVKDSGGKVAGLLTLEDVLEELVGEIRDEYDQQDALQLSRIFVSQASVMNLKAADKYAAFDELLDSLHAACPELSKDQAREFIFNREKMLSSSFAKGVAFPHARVSSILRPLVCVGISKKGIIFAENQPPVKIIFMIIVPFKDPNAQLRILAELAALSSAKMARARLLRAKTPREALEIIAEFENTVAI
jgi:CBS domain containing-hemolysin-like protein